MKRLLLVLLAGLLSGCGPDQKVGPTAVPTQSLGAAPTATPPLPSAVPSVPYPTAVGTTAPPPVKTRPPDAKPTATATATATSTPPAPLPTQVPTLPLPVGTGTP
jgi:hypothetical protein